MSCRRIALAEISLRSLTPCKVTPKWYGTQDHSRWVLRRSEDGQSGPVYYKIWNPSYVRRDNILAAIESGFYDERTVPALQALVFHQGICRGYVMGEGELHQDACTDEFRALVYARTEETGYFSIQFGHSHTMIYQGQRSLLDIEGVYPLAALPHLADHRCHMDDAAYARFVTGLYRKSAARSGTVVPDTVEAAMPPVRNALHRFLLRKSRAVMRRIRNRRPRLDLIRF
jgi:hypothetical protein